MTVYCPGDRSSLPVTVACSTIQINLNNVKLFKQFVKGIGSLSNSGLLL